MNMMRGAMKSAVPMLLSGLLVAGCGGGGSSAGDGSGDGGGGSGGGGGGGGGSTNTVPVISGTPATSVVVGADYTFVPTASDADGDSLTFEVDGAPGWAGFDPATGTLSGTPSNLDVGPFGPIVISVSDGAADASLTSFFITVPAPFERLSSELGTASIDDIDAAFMANGDGVAVWKFDLQSSEALHYSVYTAATQSWSASQELVSAPPPGRYSFVLAGGSDSVSILFSQRNQNGSELFATTFANGVFSTPQRLDETTSRRLILDNLALISSGSGYAAAWRREESYDPVTFARERTIRAAQLAAVGAAWSGIQSLNAPSDSFLPVLASNGSSAMVAWTENTATARSIWITHTVGSGWNPVPTLIEDVNSSSATALASNGSDYQLAWIGDDGGVASVLGMRLSGTFVQSAVTPLESSADVARDVHMISNGSDYLVTWTAARNSLRATVGSIDTGFDAPTTINNGANGPGQVTLTSNGSQYLVSWSQFDSRTRAWANLYDGAWQTPLALDAGTESAGNVEAAPDATGFVVNYTQAPAPRATQDLFGYRLDAATWGAGAPILLETLPDFPERLVAAGNGIDAFAYWSQQPSDDSGAQVYVSRSDAPFTSPSALVSLQPGSSVRPARLVTNDGGLTLAVWTQQNGADTSTYASTRGTSGDWSAPLELGLSVQADDNIAASDSGFAVIGTRGSPSDEDYDVVVRLFDGQAWSPVTAIDATFTGFPQSIAIASNGTGYMAAWAQAPLFSDTSFNRKRAWTSLYENGAWGGPVQIDDGAEFVQTINIGSNGTGYAGVWNNLENSLPVNIFDGTAWSGHTIIGSDGANGSPEIISDGTGYMIYWSHNPAGDVFRNAYASVSPTGAVGDFTTARVSDDSATVRPPILVASDGTGYGLAWSVRPTTGFSNDIYASLWNGSAWSTPELLDNDAISTFLRGLVANPVTGGYAVSWESGDNTDFTSSTLRANVHDGSAWLGARAVGTSDALLSQARSGGLAASDTGFGIAWVQQDGSGSGFPQVHYGTFDGTDWSSVQLENQAGFADDPLISSDGDTFTVLWRQEDPAGRPSVLLPWAYAELP